MVRTIAKWARNAGSVSSAGLIAALRKSESG